MISGSRGIVLPQPNYDARRPSIARLTTAETADDAVSVDSIPMIPLCPPAGIAAARARLSVNANPYFLSLARIIPLNIPLDTWSLLKKEGELF
jgi:hypothetical protein